MHPSDAVRDLADAYARSVFRDHDWVTITPTGTGSYTLSGLGMSGHPLAATTEADALAEADAHILTTWSTVRTTRWIPHGDEQMRALFVYPTHP